MTNLVLPFLAQYIVPYLKYILYLIAIIGFLWVNKIFVTDPVLRAWLMASFEETVDGKNKTSGKAFSAFAVTCALVIGWFIAIHYGAKHLAPEYYFFGMLSYAGGMYGMKEVGKVMTTKYTAPFNGNPTAPAGEPAIVVPSPTVVNVNISYDDAVLTEWKVSGTELVFSEWYKANKEI